MSQRKLQLLVFTSGMSVMAVEMTGLRLLAPFFGTSLVVTTILIGSMMGFLSLGYYLGGRFGDKHPTLPALGKVVAVASGLVLVIPLIAQPILRACSAILRPLIEGQEISEPLVAIGTVGGGIVGTIFLFALPVTLMGTVSPWAIRLAVDNIENSGKAAGRLYALSTFGSILGSFLPALALIPIFGVRNTFFLIGAILMLISGLCVWSTQKSIGPSVGALCLMLLPTSSVRPMDGLIHESESIYHFIQIVEEEYRPCKKAYHLYLNEGVGVHSVKCLDKDKEMRGVWNYMAATPYFRDDPDSTKDVLIVGLAGGTIARQMLQAFPEVQIDGVEIDGDVVDVGLKYLDNDHPNIRPIVMDGRIYLNNTDKSYDLIMMDAYRQPYIPFHLVTTEFFEQVDAHLTEDGILAINVASVRGVSRSLAAMIYRTLREVFPYVTLVDATASNDVLVAARTPKDPKKVLAALREKSKTSMAMKRVHKSIQNKIKGPVEGWEEARVLTDDQAPVEMAWDLMALQYGQK